MNGKFYIGQKSLSLTDYDKAAPITGVILWVDDDNCYQAGDDTGTVIENDCPYASQEMANNLLTMLNGYSYQGMSAVGARVSPTIELGDGVTVDGLYTQVAYQNVRFSTGEVVDVSAPGSEEILHEYKTEGDTTKQFSHQIAETRSQITKTAEEISLYVENAIQGLSSSFTVQLQEITGRIDGLDGNFSEISLTLDGLTVQDPSGTTLIKGSSIQTSTLYVDAANINGLIQANQLNLTGSITFGDLSSSVQGDINGAINTANDAYDLAYDNQLPSYIKSTYIDSTRVVSPTIEGGEIKGGTFANTSGSAYLEIGGSTYGDMTMWGSGNNRVFRIYDNVGGMDMSSYNNTIMNVDTTGTYPQGDWDFGGADVSGLYLRFS